jgi:hypothetical protein
MSISGGVKSSTNAKTKPSLLAKENVRTKRIMLLYGQIQDQALAGIYSLKNRFTWRKYACN